MNKVVFDAVKMTAAAMLATAVAMILNLDFYMAAGIVTVLTIQTTKRETMKTAGSRFVAFLIAIVFAYASFVYLVSVCLALVYICCCIFWFVSR